MSESTSNLLGNLYLEPMPIYGEGVAYGDGFCGHSGTINGFSTDMDYLEKLDASLVISVSIDLTAITNRSRRRSSEWWEKP